MKMVPTRYTGLMCMEGHVYCEYIQKGYQNFHRNIQFVELVVIILIFFGYIFSFKFFID